ncbi:MAG: imidazole glycerol phosphate synthase subunit HisF [Deltaproteobacteria bacterium HGW-Deltaproteobacteria-13]|jgi:cyclase|nr:MAG: imidazole glycerol phosphate synthase subunit HisF [Deltaproteobacteria bacterium HGW-Deltaproteobacteria-13]
MLKIRIIPCLLLRNESLVKTVQFNKFGYIGDPANTCRIFNELEVDELTFLDITASREKRTPNFKILEEIANECFMPLSYGGGIRDIKTAEKIFQTGFEKIILNSYPFENPEIITDLAKAFGSQSVIVAIDVKKSLLGGYHVYSLSGTVNRKRHPVEWAKEVAMRGAGEILLTSIDREGTWKGFDIELTADVAQAVKIPVIANGGAGNVVHIGDVVKKGHASAVALGSMVVYQGKDLGVLVNFPDRDELENVLR